MKSGYFPEKIARKNPGRVTDLQNLCGKKEKSNFFFLENGVEK
jgi:hypothetical protein